MLAPMQTDYAGGYAGHEFAPDSVWLLAGGRSVAIGRCCREPIDAAHCLDCH